MPRRAVQWFRAVVAIAALAAPVAHIAAGGPTCTVSAINPIAFGLYDPLSATAHDMDSTIEYECPPGLVVQVEIDTGRSGTFRPRRMSNGVDDLEYNLYVDATRQTIWGDGSNSTRVGPEQTVRDGLKWTAYVFGRIPAQQQVSAGTYTDTIRVTIQF